MRKKKKKTSDGQTIVRNMGLYWRRDRVLWSGNRRLGKARLAGKRRSAKRKGIIDFWKQTGIYALYAEYDLVYVGQAGLTDQSNLGNRLKQHLNDDLAGRWDMFSWFGLKKVNRTDNALAVGANLSVTKRTHLANVLEGIIIEVAEPPMNNQKGRFGSRVERYLQVDDRQDRAITEYDKILTSIKKIESKLKASR